MAMTARDGEFSSLGRFSHREWRRSGEGFGENGGAEGEKENGARVLGELSAALKR